MTLTPRTEEFLSYLQGLAPCGQTFEVPREWFRDIGIRNREHFYKKLNALIASGHVKRYGAGYGSTTGVLQVVRRLEDCKKKPVALSAFTVDGTRALKAPAKEEVAARVAEIPRDTRGLTARIFGDPIFERSALYQKMGGQPNA